MSDDSHPPSPQAIADEIERLKGDIAYLKARFAERPNLNLEQALTELAMKSAPPAVNKSQGELLAEIQQFKIEISALKKQIARTTRKLNPARPSDRGESTQLSDDEG